MIWRGRCAYGFGLDEVGVDLWAERGAECCDECRETIERFVVRQEVHRSAHGAGERDVREDGAHHRFDEIAQQSSPLQTLAVACLVLCQGKNSIGRAVEHAVVCGKRLWWWKRTLEVCFLTNEFADLTRPLCCGGVAVIVSGHSPQERYACRRPSL